MRLDFAFLCDYADASSKVHALGIGVDSIYAQQVPARHPQFFVVMQLRASVVESGSRSFTICLIDEDGKSLLEQSGSFQLARPVSGTETTARLVMGFYNVEFPRFGRYSFHVAVDRTEIVRIPLTIIQMPAAG